MAQEQLTVLALSATESIVGLLLSIGVILFYGLILYVAKKGKIDASLVIKVANLFAAGIVWLELIFGEFYTILGENDLTYFLIIAAVITIMNTLESD